MLMTKQGWCGADTPPCFDPVSPPPPPPQISFASIKVRLCLEWPSAQWWRQLLRARSFIYAILSGTTAELSALKNICY
jgi:hypothetical protein